MAKVKLITQADYAKLRGCSAVAVHKAVKAGRITLIDGLIDPDVANIQWEKNSRARVNAKTASATAAQGQPANVPEPDSQEPSTRLDGDEDLFAASPSTDAAPPAAPAAGDSTYATWRSRREAADAELAELNLAKERRELISVAAVEGVWASALAAMREHLLQVRARLAPMLAAESDVFKVEQLLETEHRQALQLLAAADVQKPEEGE